MLLCMRLSCLASLTAAGNRFGSRAPQASRRPGLQGGLDDPVRVPAGIVEGGAVAFSGCHLATSTTMLSSSSGFCWVATSKPWKRPERGSVLSCRGDYPTGSAVIGLGASEVNFVACVLGQGEDAPHAVVPGCRAGDDAGARVVSGAFKISGLLGAVRDHEHATLGGRRFTGQLADEVAHRAGLRRVYVEQSGAGGVDHHERCAQVANLRPQRIPPRAHTGVVSPPVQGVGVKPHIDVLRRLVHVPPEPDRKPYRVVLIADEHDGTLPELKAAGAARLLA